METPLADDTTVPLAKLDMETQKDLPTAQAASPAELENQVAPTARSVDKLASPPYPIQPCSKRKTGISTVDKRSIPPKRQLLGGCTLQIQRLPGAGTPRWERWGCQPKGGPLPPWTSLRLVQPPYQWQSLLWQWQSPHPGGRIKEWILHVCQLWLPWWRSWIWRPPQWQLAARGLQWEELAEEIWQKATLECVMHHFPPFQDPLWRTTPTSLKEQGGWPPGNKVIMVSVTDMH